MANPTKSPSTYGAGYLYGVSASLTGPSVENVDELIDALSTARVAGCVTTEMKFVVYIDDGRFYRGMVELWAGDRENTTSEVFTEDISRLRAWCEFWWDLPFEENGEPD